MDNKHELSEIRKEIGELDQQKADQQTSYKLIDKINEFNAKSPKLRWIALATLVFSAIAFYISYHVYVTQPEVVRVSLVFIEEVFNTNLFQFILVGIGAQIVDGALGMAYGATCSTFLLSLGLTPAAASASVHIAEIFTTGASGLSHLRFGNVNKKLFLYLLIPGSLGAILGAYLLADVINANIIKPIVAVYLLILGIIIIRKAFATQIKKKKTKNVGILAAFGGFMDSVGGGGWGPIVTSTLLSNGRAANYTIGSVNLAEFFIALAGAGTFLIFTGVDGWQIIIGLILGGIIASPFAALFVNKIKRKHLMILVGLLIIGLSIRTFFITDFVKVYHSIF